MPLQTNLFGKSLKRRIDCVYKDAASINTPYKRFIEAYYQANRDVPPEKKKHQVRHYDSKFAIFLRFVVGMQTIFN